MYLIDYHIHTEYSEDSNEKISNICERAIELGIKEIALTDHLEILADVEYDADIDLKSLFKSVQVYKEKYINKLIIRQGIEIGQPYANTPEANKFYEKYELDFIIGSVHRDNKGIDIPDLDFNLIEHNRLYKDYLQDLKRIAKDCDYDVLGHLTYPLRYIFLRTEKKLDLAPFKKDFEELFNIVIKRGKGIEVNTSGFRSLGTPLPNFDIIKMYLDCGGEILTIGSDAHGISFVGYNIEHTYEQLKKIGVKKISTFDKRKVIFRSL